MNKRWLIAGAVVGCLSGASLGACGNSTNTTTTGPGGSAGSTTSTNGTTTSATGTTSTSGSTTSTSGTGGSGTGGMGTGGGTGTGGDAGTCSKVTTLHPPKLDAGPGTIFCPFSSTDGGPNEYCVPGTEHCCETPAGSTTPTACQPTATACMTGSGYTDWQCEDPVADCPTGMDCCATAAPGKTPSIGLGAPGCGNFAHQMTGTKCQAAGSCVGIQMCTSDGECPAGKTCTPFGKAGNQVGGCM